MEEKMTKFTEADVEAARKYRTRSGILTAVAVGMYIICWLPMVLGGLIAESLGKSVELWGGIGLAVMMLIIAAATAILIINSATKPICLKDNKIVTVDVDGLDGDDEDDGDDDGKGEEKDSVRAAVSGAIWAIALVVFLYIGFAKGLWHPGWLAFVVAVAVNKVSDVIFAVIRKKRAEKENK